MIYVITIPLLMVLSILISVPLTWLSGAYSGSSNYELMREFWFFPLGIFVILLSLSLGKIKKMRKEEKVDSKTVFVMFLGLVILSILALPFLIDFN